MAAASKSVGAASGAAARRGEERRDPERGGEASREASSVGEVSCGESEPLAAHMPAPGVGKPPLLPRGVEHLLARLLPHVGSERAKQVGPAERGRLGRPDDEQGKLRRAPPASCEPGRERAPGQGALLGALMLRPGCVCATPSEQLPLASGESSWEKSYVHVPSS